MVNESFWKELHSSFEKKHLTLVAVSKTKPAEDINALYSLGQKDFGENYVQELVDKQAALPKDIHWHFIGHLQSNKVKYIAPFVHLIHAVDSFALLQEINKQARKNNRVINILLQMHIANEETKFGLDEKELVELLDRYEANTSSFQNVRICGMMGMATNTNNQEQLHAEFAKLYSVFRNFQQSYFLGKPYFAHCSIGMSSDYEIAINEGGNMVRIGSLLFGARENKTL
ncbi:MAG: YggS family pyridoxal phosphate-dependent enzyme [Bacteroidota bacterium]